MTLTLELTPAQEKRLREKAAEAGQKPEEYLLAVADIDDAQEEDAPTGSAYDLFKDLLGGWGSGGAVTLSENCGEQFAEGMLEKRRQGHL